MTDQPDPLAFNLAQPDESDAGPEVASRRSPIRPQEPTQAKESTQPRAPLKPAKPATGPLHDQDETQPDPSLLAISEPDPQLALERLRQQLSRVAQEYAEGNINRAQFTAIYNRYSEQRRIIEEIISRDPQSMAWQMVARPGHTSFLRQHFEARLVYYGLFVLGRTAPLLEHGPRPPRPEDLHPVLLSLPALLQERGTLKPARRQVGPDWMVVVPGRHTVSVGLYTLEPAAGQLSVLTDLHHDFERANVHALERADFALEQYVLPQRALFED